jgi:hypothetical protein
MKNPIILTLFAVILILAVACTKEEVANIPVSGDYLPMQANNYWEIEHTSKTTITGTRVINNKTYFEFVQGPDTSYYRNENNKIYSRHLTEAEALRFDLTAGVNQSWEYNNWIVTLKSKTDTLLINHTKVPNCYHFFFDIPQGADDEHGIWLAPGIGFIKLDCGFCPYPFLNLTKANINNVEITFP